MKSGEQSAFVIKIVPNGKHGAYAVVSIKDLGFVTFLLASPVWEEETWPEEGTSVVLSNVTKKRAGWRAGSVRFFRPTDEQKEKRA